MDDLISIDRPIQEVFAYVADHANDKYWKPFVTESRQVTAGQIGVGTRFEIVTVSWNYRHAGEVEILEYQPHSYYVYQAHDKIFSFIARLWFSESASGTEMRGQVEFQAKGAWKALTPLLRMFIRGQSKQTFARLKRVIESSGEGKS
jgi:hypothetical protein